MEGGQINFDSNVSVQDIAEVGDSGHFKTSFGYMEDATDLNEKINTKLNSSTPSANAAFHRCERLSEKNRPKNGMLISKPDTPNRSSDG